MVATKIRLKTMVVDPGTDRCGCFGRIQIRIHILKKTLGLGSRSGFYKYRQCSVLKKSGKTITTSLDFLTLFFFQQKTCLINMYLTFFPAVLIRSDTRSIILRCRGWVWCRSFSVFALFPIALFLLISLCCGCCKTKEVQTLSA